MSDRPRVLMIDDEKELCELLGELLSREGYEVECVHNAPAAMAKLTSASYDVVLTDLVMPGTSGVDLLRMISKASSDTPIIVFTGSEPAESETMATGLNVSSHLRKGTTTGQDLVEAIEQALGNPPPD